jgi:hypothetical protein
MLLVVDKEEMGEIAQQTEKRGKKGEAETKGQNRAKIRLNLRLIQSYRFALDPPLNDLPFGRCLFQDLRTDTPIGPYPRLLAGEHCTNFQSLLSLSSIVVALSFAFILPVTQHFTREP